MFLGLNEIFFPPWKTHIILVVRTKRKIIRDTSFLFLIFRSYLLFLAFFLIFPFLCVSLLPHVDCLRHVTSTAIPDLLFRVCSLRQAACHGYRLSSAHVWSEFVLLSVLSMIAHESNMPRFFVQSLLS